MMGSIAPGPVALIVGAEEDGCSVFCFLSAGPAAIIVLRSGAKGALLSKVSLERPPEEGSFWSGRIVAGPWL